MNKYNISIENQNKRARWVCLWNREWNGEPALRLALRNKLKEENKRGSYVYGMTAMTNDTINRLFGYRHIATSVEDAMFFEDVSEFENFLKEGKFPINEVLIHAVYR